MSARDAVLAREAAKIHPPKPEPKPPKFRKPVKVEDEADAGVLDGVVGRTAQEVVDALHSENG